MDARTRQPGDGPWASLVALARRALAWALGTKPVRAFLLYQEHHGAMLADSVSYRALFSIFAGVFLGFAIAGIWLSGNSAALAAVVATLGDVIPGLVGEDGLIATDALVQPIPLGIAGILALVGAVGAAIGAIGSLRTAFRDLADRPADQTFFGWLLLRDLLLAIGFGAALVVAAAVTLYSAAALGAVFAWFGVAEDSVLFGASVNAVSILVVFAIDTVTVAVMFRTLAGLRPNARSLWSGAVVGGIGLSVLQLLSGWFVGGATSNPLLVSFASLIALLIWVNFSSQVILIAGAYVVTGVEEQHDRERARAGAATLAERRVLVAEKRVTDAAAELDDARAAVRNEG